MDAATPTRDFGPGSHRFRDPLKPHASTRRLERLAPHWHPDAALVASYRRAHFRGDPAADTLVEWMHLVGLREGRTLFEQALEHGLASVRHPHDALRSFFEDVESVPAWLDRRALHRACRLIDRVSIGQSYVLFSISLLSGYASAGVTKTLAATGELEGMAARRVAETSKFLEDVYRSRTLERASDGFKSVVRVRVMHAFVRHKLLRSGWATERWGLPINQADMAGTVLSFSSVYLIGLRMLGFFVPLEDREALVHLWRYVGRLLGVDESLLPATERESVRLLKLVASTQEGPDEDGRALARALLRVPVAYRREGMLGEILTRVDTAFCAGLARAFIGDEAADGLGLPDAGWKYAVWGVAAVNASAELVRFAVPAAQRTAARMGRAINARRLRTLLGDHPVTFEPRTVAASVAEGHH